MIAISDLLLGVLVLGVGIWLSRRGRPLVRVVLFCSALLVSALLFLPGAQITGAVGPDGIAWMRRLAAHTPWNVSDWVHFLIFLWLGLLLWLVRPDLRNWKGWAVEVILAIAAELAQDLAPGRAPRLDDVLLNLAGGMLGVVLAIALRRLARRL